MSNYTYQHDPRISGADFEDREHYCDQCGGYDEDCPECGLCYYCQGEGYGIVGTDWDCTDGVNGPHDGEVEQCPCCGGSGKKRDESFW